MEIKSPLSLNALYHKCTPAAIYELFFQLEITIFPVSIYTHSPNCTVVPSVRNSTHYVHNFCCITDHKFHTRWRSKVNVPIVAWKPASSGFSGKVWANLISSHIRFYCITGSSKTWMIMSSDIQWHFKLVWSSQTRRYRTTKFTK